MAGNTDTDTGLSESYLALLAICSQNSQIFSALVLENRSYRRSLVENVPGIIRTVSSLWNQDDIIAFSPKCGLST